MERDSLTNQESMVGNYLLYEFKTISGKTFHNDFLRVFVHYGFLGVLIFIRSTYKLFSYDIGFYFAFLFLSFFSSIVTSSFGFTVY